VPEKLAKTVAALDRSPRAVLVYSDYVPIDEAGKEIRPSSFSPAFAHPPSMSEMLERLWPFHYTTVVMRKSVYDYCEDFRAKAGSTWSGLSMDYMSLLARERGEFIYLNEPLARILRIGDPLAFGKWEAHIFIEVVRKRYGDRARGLIAHVRDEWAANMALRAAREMDSGALRVALKSWLEVLRYRPLYFLRPHTVGLVFTGRGLRRALKCLRPRSR